MYWRRSLVATVILVIAGYLSGMAQNTVFKLLYDSYNMSSSDIIPIISIMGFVTGSLLHFFILWPLFRYFGEQEEKRKRTNGLRVEEVLELMDEDELEELRQRLSPPSKRGESF